MLHNIPTAYKTTDADKGHYSSDVTLLIEGSNRNGGPGGWFVGGWSVEGIGRKVFQGPWVPGPVAYVGGLCNFIDCHGGSGAEKAAKDAAGLLVRCKADDTLRIDGVTYTLSLSRSGYPSLTVTVN